MPQEMKKLVMAHVPMSQLAIVKQWLRTTMLDEDAPEAVKDLAVKMYTDLAK